MAEYKYDEEGGQFLTFVLTFLLLVLVPLSYSLLVSIKSKAGSYGSFDAPGQKVAAIKKTTKRSLTNPQISKKFVLVVLGWCFVALLSQRIMNTASNSSHKVYDPFQILDIASSATEKEIKKHYKRLSVKFHPDKLVFDENNTKEAAETHYIELTKAYKSLTDETIRKNFQLYGHPDGRQEMSMGIALPRWVVESQNNIYVLGLYGVLFGIGLPFLVARWWYGSRSKTKDGIISKTAQTYFQHLREDTPPARILALLAISQEFQHAALDKGRDHKDQTALDQLEKDLRQRLQQYGPSWALVETFRSPSIRKALVLLYAHTLRVETSSERLTQAKFEYANKAVQLLNSMVSISLAHNWLQETEVLMDMIQRIVQAVPIMQDPAAQLLQLPSVSHEIAKKLVESSSTVQHGIQGLWKVADPERRKIFLSGGISESEYDDCIKTMGSWPRIELMDAFFKVPGEKQVTSGAIVKFVVKLRLLPPKKDGSLLRQGSRLDAKRVQVESDVRQGTEEDDDVKLDALIGRKDPADSEKEGKQPIGFARAPYFLEERKPSWWVMLGDPKLDRVIVQPTKVSDIGPDKVRTFSVQFQAPPQPGLYTFNAILKSDSYLGCDAVRSVKMKVDDPAALEDQDVEDEISDPEEDSLAGQMALMKGEKVKQSRNQDSQEDDSEEEEENRQDNQSSTDDEEEEQEEQVNVENSDSDSD